LLIFVYFLTLLGTVGLLLLAKSYRHLDLSTVAPLTNLAPALVLILAFFILDERLKGVQLAGIGLLICGTYVLETRHIKNFKKTLEEIFSNKYILLVFIALFFLAFISIGEKQIIHGIHPFALLFYIYVFTFINATILLMIKYDGLKGIKHGINKSGKLIFVDAVFATTTNLLYLNAISLAFVSLVVTIKQLSTLFAVLLGGSFFHEKHLKRKTFACLIMLFGVFLITL